MVFKPDDAWSTFEAVVFQPLLSVTSFNANAADELADQAGPAELL